MHWNFKSVRGVRVAKNNFQILFPLNISKYFSSVQPFSSQHHLKGTEHVFLKDLGNIKRRHWDLYTKPDASIGLIKKPQNYKNILGLFKHISYQNLVLFVIYRQKFITLISLWINFILKQITMFGLQFVGPFKSSFCLALFTLPAEHSTLN